MLSMALLPVISNENIGRYAYLRHGCGCAVNDRIGDERVESWNPGLGLGLRLVIEVSISVPMCG